MKPNTTKKKAKAVSLAEVTRQENVRALVLAERYSKRQIAKMMGFTPAVVHQWLSAPSSTGHRAISENMARLIEEKLHLPTRALDDPLYGPGLPRPTQEQIAERDAEALVDEIGA